MSKGNGIITLSLGPTASIVNTHFWNSTSQLDQGQSALFHQPASHGKSTPRLVVVDWAGGSTVRKQWMLQRPGKKRERVDDGDPGMELDGLFHPPATKSGGSRAGEAVFATEEVAYWWKYMTPDLHSRSVHLLNESAQRGTTSTAFGDGIDAWKTLSNQEEIIDSIRFFAEGLDVCSGFHVVADCDSVFGGMAVSLLNDVKDIFGRTPLFTSALFPYHEEEPPQHLEHEVDFDRLRRAEERSVNRSLATSLLSAASSSYVPIDMASWASCDKAAAGWLSGPTHAASLSLDITNPVDAGAVAALALGAATSPWKMSQDKGGRAIFDMCAHLRSIPSMRLATLASIPIVPVRMQQSGYTLRSLLESLPVPSAPELLHLSHPWPLGDDGGRLVTSATQTIAQCFSVCGLSYMNDSSEQVVCEVYSQTAGTPRTLASVLQHPGLTSSTFPSSILPPGLNVAGCLDDEASREPYTEETVPQQFPTIAQLSTTNATALYLHRLAVQLRGMSSHRHTTQGLEPDAWRELVDDVETLVEDYDANLIRREDSDVD
eukprot:Sspe_Gene.61316::Locus_34013_Transcript_1_1_Confidence_1.000_Length_1724::g.61316::m.61316